MQLIKRIYLSEIGPLIGRRDNRSIKKWCRSNALLIYKDSSGEFLYHSEFVVVYEAPLINQLKKQHGSGWLEVYKSYKNNTLHEFVISPKEQMNRKNRYIPKGSIARSQLLKNEKPQ